ncbi:MAG: chemotaxis response regulator protein-glutamate methylesterase [Polyangiaceae bacterium]|nr:chemotaxis response regulator protein-glutamate methylesterase [Polyangiaceae bacterium]
MLIVDDSVVVRRLLSDVITESSELVVAGIAANGRIALGRIPQVNPDIVVLDVEMPELDGLQTLVEIRKLYPRLPVVMFSSLTERGAATTLEALTGGASDYVTKPTSLGGQGSASDQVRSQLIPKLLALCGNRVKVDAPSARPFPTLGAPQRAILSPVEIVVIGTSTGGPNALGELLPRLPADFPVPILVTQHMPPMFTRLLAERLNSKCQLAVREAQAGELLAPGTIWIAPGDFHLGLERSESETVLTINQDPPENGCRPAVDSMFRSAAALYGGKMLAVVLTGMGQDGARGAEQIRELGGQVFAQDEETSVVWGMPGAVVRNQLAHKVLPLQAMAQAICDAVSLSLKRESPVSANRSELANGR